MTCLVCEHLQSVYKYSDIDKGDVILAVYHSVVKLNLLFKKLLPHQTSIYMYSYIINSVYKMSERV